MSYLEQEGLEEVQAPKSLIFNKGEAGVVNGCKVVVEKKGSGDSERAPQYKVLAYDTEQTTNSDDTVKVYPVNKGYFYSNSFDKNLDKNENYNKGNFSSAGAEKFAVNELRHLLKTFGHDVDDKGMLTNFSRELSSYNDFMDYTFEFVNKSLKENKGQMFNIAVDYGDDYRSFAFLRLAGYPWYIMKSGDKIENVRGAIMKRPTKDEEESPYKSDSEVEKDLDWA